MWQQFMNVWHSKIFKICFAFEYSKFFGGLDAGVRQHGASQKKWTGLENMNMGQG